MLLKSPARKKAGAAMSSPALNPPHTHAAGRRLLQLARHESVAPGAWLVRLVCGWAGRLEVRDRGVCICENDQGLVLGAAAWLLLAAVRTPVEDEHAEGDEAQEKHPFGRWSGRHEKLTRVCRHWETVGDSRSAIDGESLGHGVCSMERLDMSRTETLGAIYRKQ